MMSFSGLREALMSSWLKTYLLNKEYFTRQRINLAFYLNGGIRVVNCDIYIST